MKDGDHSKPGDFFEQEEITPINLASLTNASNTSDSTHVLSRLPQDERTQTTAGYYLQKYENLGSTALSNTIKNEFAADQKPTYLDVLSVDYEQAVTKNINDGGLRKDGMNYWTDTNFIGNINTNNKKDRRLRRKWSLDTKLKDINSDPRRWYYMLRNYTGVKIAHKSPGIRRNLPLQLAKN